MSPRHSPYLISNLISTGSFFDCLKLPSRKRMSVEKLSRKAKLKFLCFFFFLFILNILVMKSHLVRGSIFFNA